MVTFEVTFEDKEKKDESLKLSLDESKTSELDLLDKVNAIPTKPSLHSKLGRNKEGVQVVAQVGYVRNDEKKKKHWALYLNNWTDNNILKLQLKTW